MEEPFDAAVAFRLADEAWRGAVGTPDLAVSFAMEGARVNLLADQLGELGVGKPSLGAALGRSRSRLLPPAPDRVEGGAGLLQAAVWLDRDGVRSRLGRDLDRLAVLMLCLAALSAGLGFYAQQRPARPDDPQSRILPGS